MLTTRYNIATIFITDLMSRCTELVFYKLSSYEVGYRIYLEPKPISGILTPDGGGGFL